MKKFKTMLALCLALLTAFSVMSVGASAEDGETASVSRFVVEDSCLVSIDLSDQIRDQSTVNTGKLQLKDETYADAIREGKFDPEKPGYFLLGYYDEDGSFEQMPWSLDGYDTSFTLSAAEGDLYDDVASFSFTMKDILDSMTETTAINLPEPEISVVEKDGDLVKKLALDFQPDYLERSIVFDAADLNKEITLTVTDLGFRFRFRAVPVRFSDNVLTVALYDGDKEGVALHGLKIAAGDTVRYSGRPFEFSLPEGLLCCGNCVVSAECDLEYESWNIDGLPFLDVVDLHIPAWVERLTDKLFSNDKIAEGFAGFIAMFFVPHIVRMLVKSLKMYGLNIGALIRDYLRSGAWKEAVKDLFKNMFRKK